MRKHFHELTTRQKNRRLQAYESQQQQISIACSLNITPTSVHVNVDLVSNSQQPTAIANDNSDGSNDNGFDNISMFHDRENIENEINEKKFPENANKNEKLLN